MAKRRYGTLDGLRGAAAFIVLIGHLSGPFHGLARHGYLAVDLFFLMSGFVVAGSYEPKLLAGGGVGAFVSVRLKRLWPLYALSFVVGIACYAIARQLRPADNFLFPALPLADVVAMGLLFVPQVTRFGGGAAFPLNPAAWSLSIEFFGNVAYALCARALTERTLKAIVAVAALGLAVVLYRSGSLNVGADVSDLAFAAIRYAFSFSLGVLICRLEAQGRLPGIPIPPAAVIGLAAVAMSGLMPDWPVYDFAVAVLVFPVLVVAAIRREPRLGGLCAWAGAVSYPLYILHEPVTGLIFTVVPHGMFHILLVLALPPVFVAAAAAAERWFDRPVRRILNRLPAAAPGPRFGWP